MAGAVFVVFGAVTLVFAILHLLPGDPAALVAGDGASQDTINSIRAHLGTDRPFWLQYVDYLRRLSHGDLGTSYATGEPVLSRILSQLPATLALTSVASIVAISSGVLLGVVSAVNKDRWIDRAIQAVVLFLTSMPPFWIGILLILVFSVTLRWLPAIGNGTPRQLVLPVLCLGLNLTGRLERMVRSGMIEVLGEPFVTALRAKGMREATILVRHVLRNVLIPVATLFAFLAGELLSSSVVVETVFARQGLGRLVVEALSNKDIPVLQGVVLFASVIFVLINLGVDLSYLWIDPRTRASGAQA